MFVKACSYLSWADHKFLIECIGHNLLARDPKASSPDFSKEGRDPKTSSTDFSKEEIRPVMSRNREGTTICSCDLPWKGKQSDPAGA